MRNLLLIALLIWALTGCERFGGQRMSGSTGDVRLIQPILPKTAKSEHIEALQIKMVSQLDPSKSISQTVEYEPGSPIKLDKLEAGPYSLTVGLYQKNKLRYYGHLPSIQVFPSRTANARLDLYRVGQEPGGLAVSLSFGDSKKAKENLKRTVATSEPKVSKPKTIGSRKLPKPPSSPMEITHFSGRDGIPCGPVKYFHYNLPVGAFRVLSCEKPTELFNIAVPAKGFALARAQLALGNSSNVPYGWSSEVKVGRPVISQNKGDVLCSGTTGTSKNLLGYGELKEGQTQVQVELKQASGVCTENKVVVLAGASLDVWVEAPECPKRDIIVGSRDQSGASPEACLWQDGLRPALSIDVTTSPERSGLTILTSAEASFEPNFAAACGQEAAALVTAATLDGASLGSVTGMLPGGEGKGRLALSGEHTVTPAPGRHQLGLSVGGNFPQDRQPASCGGTAILGVVRTPGQ